MGGVDRAARRRDRARRELAALAATALDVCEEFARAGLESSDVPRLWLSMLVHQARDEGRAVDLAVLTTRVRAWLGRESRAPGAAAAQWRRAVSDVLAMRFLLTRRNQTRLHPGRPEALLSDTLPEVLVTLGEAPRAAAARVANRYRAHCAEMGVEPREAPWAA